MNNDLKVGESDLLHTFRPDTLVGALIYLVLFVAVAILISRAMRTLVPCTAMTAGIWMAPRSVFCSRSDRPSSGS